MGDGAAHEVGEIEVPKKQIDIPAPSQGQQVESPFLTRSVPRQIPETPIESFTYTSSNLTEAPTIEVMLQAINVIKDKDYYFGQEIITDSEGKKYTIRSVQTGKHARVCIVDAEDGSSSFVVRGSAKDGREALHVIRNYPTAERYLPITYAISDDYDFTVMEKVTGIEDEELMQRMKDDPEFVERYAHAFARMLQDVYQSGLEIADVSYAGHNIMVNPQTGEIKFVEQRCLRPAEEVSPGLSAEELLSNFIFDNLDSLYRESNDENIDPVLQRAKERFMLHVLKECAKDIDLREIFMRSKRYNKTFRFYELYCHILGKGETDEPVASPYEEHLLSRILSSAVMNAIESEDFDSFSSLIRNDSFFEEITDESDSRYAPRIIN